MFALYVLVTRLFKLRQFSGAINPCQERYGIFMDIMRGGSASGVARAKYDLSITNVSLRINVERAGREMV